MPLSPTRSTTVTPSDTVHLPQGYNRTSPFPALCLLALTLLSFGESRHNRHHADPTSARHGVDRGRFDPSVTVIRLLERLSWVHDVRRPSPARVDTRRA